MTSRLDIGLTVLVLSIGIVAIQRVSSATDAVRLPEPVISRAPTVPDVVNSDSLVDDEAMIVENNLFRLTNRPSSVPFTIAQKPIAERMRSTPPPKPTLVLRAIMGGPPWLAILDGIPGQGKGVLVRQGDSFEKLVVQSIGRDTVLVKAPDTLWTLTLRRMP